MADVYKNLAQAVSTGGDVNLYTVPASTAAIISSLVVSNFGNEDLLTVRVRVAGAAKANKQVVCNSLRVPYLGQVAVTIGLTLGAGDIVTVTSAGSNLAYNLYGVEQNPVPAIVPKILAQIEPAAATSTLAYTVPVGKSAILNYSVANLNTAMTAVRLSHSVGGGSIASKDMLLNDYQMSGVASGGFAPPDANLLVVQGITAAAGDIFRVRSSLANCAFNLWGVEL